MLRILLVAVAGACLVAAQSRPPNVLFLSIDDLNDWVGALGGHPQARTPNIDRLAARGVLYTNAHCASPLCTPSRTAIFTGKAPWNTEVYSNGDRLRVPGLVTLPAHFRANGYQTITAGKTFPARGAYLGAAWDEQGPGSGARGPQGGPFTAEEYDRRGKPPHYLVKRLGVTRPLSGMIDRRTHHNGGSFDWGGLDLPDDAFGDGVVADWAVDRIASLSEKPFFMAVGFYRPHTPLYAPQRYFDNFAPAETELPPTQSDDLGDVPEAGRLISLVAATAGNHSWVTDSNQWNAAVAAYLACVEYVDTQTGKVLDALARSPYANNTIIVLWSDHGWHLGEKQHWGKWTGWERSTRVPLIIVVPESLRSSKFRPGTNVDAPVSLIDLYPTLVTLASLPEVEGLDGESLAGNTSGVRVVNFGRGSYTVVQGFWRYVHYFDGSEELYNLQTDPNQYRNLAADKLYESKLSAMRKHLPETPEIAYTARYRHYKAVFHTDTGRPPLLYDQTVAEGVTDRGDIAADHPEILDKIRTYVRQSGLSERRFEVPAE